MIRVLDDQVVNKIAAGEVVERPASVVKELVENALDAGATDLRVELRGGGRTLIRITDNGSGMDRQDATLCLERHATSKIRTDEDLFRVATLGFRGEAIPSIASVSRFELLTRTPETPVGTRLVVEGGRILDIADAGCAPGTQIYVRNLFFNVPARRKFLRSTPTELGHALEAVIREALIRPALDVEVQHEGQISLRAPVVADRASRAGDILGPHGRALIPARFVRGNLEVDALMSPVGVHRASPQGATYLYVNGRFVKDMLLRRAVGEAYRGLVPKGRYPTVVLEVRVPPDHVDVNVHPAKTEVRFQFAGDLEAALATGLREALQRAGIKAPVDSREQTSREQVEAWSPDVEQASLPLPSWDASAEEQTPEPSLELVESEAEPALAPEDPSAPAPAVARAPAAQVSRSTVPPSPRPAALTTPPRPAPSYPAPAPTVSMLHERPPQATAPVGRGAGELLPVPRFLDLRVIGQLGRTYVLCEGAGELVIIDQHAAHERITLHRLQSAERARLGGGQRLLTPVLVELSPARAAALEPHADLLARYGLEIEPFGGATFAVKQIPEALGSADVSSLLVDVADDLAAGGRGEEPARALIERLLNTMACHSSVRAGQSLSPYEMRELLRALDEVDFGVCAHGRPVAIRVASNELEHRFHRS